METQHVIPETTKLRFSDPAYTPATADDLRELMRQTGLTGSQTARLIGVNSRTIRKWTTSEGMPNSAEIPYAAWRLLLIETRVIQNEPEIKRHNYDA